MTNNPIETNLDVEEVILEIDLLNKITGTTYPKAAVYGTNTLGQILNEYAYDIGVSRNTNRFLFENKRTGNSTNNSGEIVNCLGLQAGDILAISDDCPVA